MRNQKHYRGNTTSIRNMILVLLLSFLPFVFCSKGNRGDIVVLPSLDSINNNAGGGRGQPLDNIGLDPSRNPQETGFKFHPQMSPIMSVETFNDIEKEVNTKIGTDKFPQDELMFLFTEPGAMAESNPPVLCFAFAAPENAIWAEDIEVTLDGVDISKLVRYNFLRSGTKSQLLPGELYP